MRVTRLLASTACATALLASAGQLHAQSTEADNSDAAVAEEAAGEKESIVVTGSRIVRQGYVSATPISTTTAEEMGAISPRILDAVMDLPQFSPVSSLVGSLAANIVSAGASPSTLNLRQLGAQRNLILIDGRRAPAIDDRALFDIGLLPDPLIRRVDVITGGASAAYGSDAVTGASNFILDTNYAGIKAEIASGISDYGDGFLYKSSLTFGTPFADGRGHVVASVNWFHQDSLTGVYDGRDWRTRGRGTINSPVGVFPTRTRYDSGVYTTNPPAGRITSGPLAALNVTFNDRGDPVFFKIATVSDANNQLGGEPVFIRGFYLRPEQNRLTGFVHAEFEVAPDHKLWVEASAAHSRSITGPGSAQFAAPNAITIFSDNAFLTPATKALMAANNVTTFQLRRQVVERPPLLGTGDIKHYRGSVGLDGTISGDWTYAAHVRFSRSDTHAFFENNINWRPAYAAFDAVRNPANGQIVCRSTLAGLDPGCVPANVFGLGNISDASWDYMTREDPHRYMRTDEWNAAVSSQAPLFSLWSDPAILVAGYEFRKHDTNQEVSDNLKGVPSYTGLRGVPNSRLTSPTNFASGNFSASGGTITVHEVFGELDVPIVKDRPMFHSLALNGAVRYTHYDPSGPVTSWKVSANYEPVPGLRLRGAVSRDIRAPTLFDLYQPGLARALGGNVTVPGVGLVPLLFFDVGNLDLVPEKSDSITYGAVLQPRFLPGLTLSVDRFHVKVKDAIGTVGGAETNAAQSVVDACRIQMAAASCAFLEFVPGVSQGEVYSQVIFRSKPINSQLLEIKGIDFEGSYTTQLGAGRFSIRALASLLEAQTSGLPGAPLVNRVGESGNPKWKGSLRGSYSQGPFRMSLGARYLGPTKLDITWVEGIDVDDNTIDSRTYFDTSIGYTIEDERAGEMELSLSVQNLLNSEPPNGGGQAFDTMGRFFNFSVKLRR